MITEKSFMFKDAEFIFCGSFSISDPMESSSVDLERILTKDISPGSFKDSSVDSTRHYFGPTRKIYVYSGVLCACPHLMGHTYILGNQFRKDPV